MKKLYRYLSMFVAILIIALNINLVAYATGDAVINIYFEFDDGEEGYYILMMSIPKQALTHIRAHIQMKRVKYLKSTRRQQQSANMILLLTVTVSIRVI